MAALKAWDLKWSAASTETSLAVFWGEALWAKAAPEAKKQGVSVYRYMAERTTPAQKLAALTEASDRLTTDFGDWRTPWGQINRFQRNDGAIVQTFDDAKPTHPRAVRLGPVGLAGLVRGQALSRHEAVLRDQRQQLRGRGRVRAEGEGHGGVGRRRERRSGLKALRRPGPALRRRGTCGRSISIPSN